MKIDFAFQGKTFSAEAELIAGQIWVYFQGKTWCLDSEATKSKRKKVKAGSVHDFIAAPMPGKIIKVLAAAGNEVQVGQVVVIMEAMKMEYSLKADRVQTIDQILVKAGDQVKLGDQLVTFKKEPSL